MSGTQLAIEGGLGSTKDRVWGLLKDSELVLQVMYDMELVPVLLVNLETTEMTEETGSDNIF